MCAGYRSGFTYQDTLPFLILIYTFRTQVLIERKIQSKTKICLKYISLQQHKALCAIVETCVNNQSNKTHSIFYKLSFPLRTFTVLDRHYENQFKTLTIIHLLNVAFIVYILMCTYHKCYLSFS